MTSLKRLNPLVVVADASRAQFFTTQDQSDVLVERATLVNGAGHLDEQDLVSDRPGRSFDSQGGGSHAMDAKSTAKDHAMETFAREVIAAIPQQLEQWDVRRIVLVAAPRFLGELRKAMTPAVSKALHSEIDGDYTTHTPQHIAQAVSKKLA